MDQQSPIFLAPETGFAGYNFSMNWWWRGGDFRMTEVHYIYCALCFYRYYIVIYNEIIIHHFITHHNAESAGALSFFSWNQLWVMEDSDTHEVSCLCPVYSVILFQLLLLQKTLLLKDKMLEMESRLFSAFVAISKYFALTLI